MKKKKQKKRILAFLVAAAMIFQAGAPANGLAQENAAGTVRGAVRAATPSWAEKTDDSDAAEDAFSEETPFDLSKGSVVIGESGASGYDQDGKRVKSSPSDAWLIVQSEPEKPTGNTVTVKGTDCRITLRSLNMRSEDGKQPLFDVQKGAGATLILEGESQVVQFPGSAYAAIHTGEGAFLTFSEDSTGSLTAETDGAGAAIGGNEWESGGTVSINGGSVTALTGAKGAGIGGGFDGGSGIIQVNGGKVRAEVTHNHAGGGSAIGGGWIGYTDEIIITGGIVDAKAGWGIMAIGNDDYYHKKGSIMITGGTVRTVGDFQGRCMAAGRIAIGGDSVVDAKGTRVDTTIRCGAFEMTGGTVTVEQKSAPYACVDTESGRVTAGTLTVRSDGGNGLKGNFTITGGNVMAAGGWAYGGYGAAGIGGEGADVTITGGTVTAIGGKYAPGIGASIGEYGIERAGRITITGGAVHAIRGSHGVIDIGNGIDSKGVAVWPTDGIRRVYPLELSGVEDLKQLAVDGRSAENMGIAEYSDPETKTVWLYLPEGSHTVENGEDTQTVTVKATYSLEIKKAKQVREGEKEELGPWEPGSRIRLKADSPEVGFSFLKWKVVGADEGADLFSDPASAETTLTMPAADILVEAVFAQDIESLEVLQEPYQMEYQEDDKLSLEGLKLAIHQTDGVTRIVTPAEFSGFGISEWPLNGESLPYFLDDHHLDFTYGKWRVNTKGVLKIHPRPVVEVSVAGTEAVSDPADPSGHLLLAELPFGTPSLPSDPVLVTIRVTNGKADAPVTQDGGKNWKFSVEDSSGKKQEYRILVSIGDQRFQHKITVLDGRTASPLSGVWLEAVTEDGTVLSARTGENGEAALELKNGTYRISAGKDGYLLRTASLTVADQPGTLTIPLNTRDTVKGTVSQKEMTRDEIKQAGIDPDAEENRHLFRFSVTLEFTSGTGGTVGLPVSFIGREDGYSVAGSSASSIIDGTKVTVYPLSEKFYLVIYGEAGWLKEMFDVSLVILNDSAVEEIQNCAADLKLPDGLSLAAPKGEKEQNLHVSLGTIGPKKTAQAHWYVRGDRAGSFTPSVRVTGSMASQGVDPQPFDYLFTPQSPLEVLAGSALHLTIEAEDRTWNQDDYNVRFILTNVSSHPVENLSFHLTGEEQYRISKIRGDQILKKYKQTELSDGLKVEELAPGESVDIAFSTVIQFDSQISPDPEYVLTNYFLTMLEGSTTAIPHSFLIKRGYRSSHFRQLSMREYPGQKQASAGDPVDLLTGGFDWSYEDAAIAGRNPVSYERYYRSDDSEGTARLGPGWSDSYSWEIGQSEKKWELTGETVVSLKMPGGERAFFFGDGKGGYESREGSGFSLKAEGEGYLLTEQGGTKRSFDSRGFLRMVQTVDGKEITLSYYDGRLSSAGDESGRLYFSYNDSGRLTTLTDGAGKPISYRYKAGRLSATVNQDGDEFLYAYDSSGCLTSVTVPGGIKAIENEYDGAGRVILQKLSGQGEYRYTYDGEKHENTCRGENGYERRIRYDDWDRITEETSPTGTRRYEYDEKNRLVSEADAAGIKTIREYDNAGNLSRILYGDGTWEEYVYNGKGQVTGIRDQSGISVSYEYDEAGRLISYKDPMGEASTASYDGKGNLASITDALGAVTRYTYDDRSRVASVTDPEGRTVSFAYDGAGRVTGVTAPAGGTSSYHYSAAGKQKEIIDSMGQRWKETVDARGLATEILDPDGRKSRYGYDLQGRLASIRGAGGTEASFEYDTHGNLVSRTDGDGNRTTFRYDGAGRMTEETDPEGNAISFGYDGNGRLASMSNALGETTSCQYDAMGRLISVEDPLGRIAAYRYDGMGNLTETLYPDGSTEKTAYDSSGRVVSQTDADGGTVRYEYDGAGRLTAVTDQNGGRSTYEYDRAGRLTAYTGAAGGTIRYSYGAGNRPVSVTDQLGNITEYHYDSAGRLISEKDAAGEKKTVYDAYGNITERTDEEGGVIHFRYDGENRLTAALYPDGSSALRTYDKAGNVASETDGNGNRMEYSYDKAGRLISITDGIGNRSTRSYDGVGRLIGETDASGAATAYSYDRAGRLTGIVDAMGHITSYEYDRMDRLLKVRDALGDEAVYTYDRRGNVTGITDGAGRHTACSYDAAGNRTAVTTAAGTVRYEYDAENRLVRQAFADGSTGTWEYDLAGNVTAVTGPGGSRTRYTYDQAGRLTGVEDAEGGRTSCTRSGTGNPLEITDAEGRITRYEYDAVGRIIKAVTPAGGTETIRYDGAGNVTARTDGAGCENAYAYDGAGRLVKITGHGGNKGESDREASFMYDAMGRLTEASDLTGTTAIERDLLGRITSVTDGRGKTVKSSYDAAGRRTGLIYPGGEEVGYRYDGAGRILSVTSGEKSFTYHYDAMGRPDMRTDPAGVTEHYGYDGRGNLLTVTREMDGREQPYRQFRYDMAGNRISETGEGHDWEYHYDDLNRLAVGIDAQTGDQFFFSYDRTGNRIRSIRNGVTTDYQLDKAGRLSGTVETDQSGKKSETSYLYDGRGNRTEESGPAGVLKYRYDALGRLEQTEGRVSREYQYNSLGMLCGRDGEWLVSDYAGGGGLLETTGDGTPPEPTESGKLSESASMAVRYLYGNGRIGAEAQKGGDMEFWTLYTDALGSTEEAVPLTGRGTLGTTVYDPYGSPAESVLSVFAGETLDLTTGYTGYQYDPFLGLYNAGARLYDSDTGSFLSPDPLRGNLEDPMTGNPYLYGRANPFFYTDPTGMSFLSSVKKFGQDSWSAGKKLYRKAAAWTDRVFGDKVRYYPVMRCDYMSFIPVTERGLGSRISQGLSGGMMVAGGVTDILLGTTITAGSDGLGAAFGVGLIVTGTSGVGYGTSEIMEAFTDHNPVRDEMMAGNRKLYYGGMNATNTASLVLNLAGAGYALGKTAAGEFLGDESGGLVRKGGSGAGTRSNISSEMQDKILEGQRVGTSNKIIGGHSPNAVNNNNPNFAVEEVKINADGTKVVKYYKQFPDGNVSRLKTSTLFPDSWTDSDIIDAVQNIADSKPIGVRQLDGQSLHRGTINGIDIDVIKQGNDVISGYPVGGKPTPGFDPVNN